MRSIHMLEPEEVLKIVLVRIFSKILCKPQITHQIKITNYYTSN
jgi:hypothetical protein